MDTSSLKKKQAVANLFQLQYVIMKNEVNALKIKSHNADALVLKSQQEYSSVLKGVSELQRNFGFALENKVYDDSFLIINRKYNEYLMKKKSSEEIKEILHHKMNLVVIHKRKIDHLNDNIRNFKLVEFYNNLD